jgi:hypothetical protein
MYIFTIAHSLLETLLGGLPVDHVPDSIEIFGLAVLILETTKYQHYSNQMFSNRSTKCTY